LEELFADEDDSEVMFEQLDNMYSFKKIIDSGTILIGHKPFKNPSKFDGIYISMSPNEVDN
jgi:hypothetical protein